MTTATIGELSATADTKNIYQRSNGEKFIKLNERFHIKTKLSDDGKTWLGDGIPEEIDLNERVTVIQ